MKTRSIFLILFFACQAIFAQTTGISVQGIARDANKAALVDEPLTFTFEILEASGGTSYYKEDVDIKTDPYGVFSHIIGTGNVLAGSGNFNEIPFGKTHMKLVISVDYNGNNIVISNSPFQYAPYAKSADNGVPTGTIVAFMGTEANVPQGWTLCDGSPLNTVAGSANLVALIGPNAPDLRGMFLRGIGTGTNTSSGQEGPSALGQIQQDGFQTHDITGTTNPLGAHSHTFLVDTGGGGDHGGGDMVTGEGFGNNIANNVQTTSGVPNHTHSVTGSSSGGIDETRPVNYGVNYIIKL